MNGPWITVAEAAIAAGRSLSTMYEWIESGKVRSRVGDDGILRIDGQHLVEVEPTVRRGRPRGSASSPSTRRRGAA